MRVTNAFGTVTSQAATLNVFVNPIAITNQPDRVAVEVGEAFSLLWASGVRSPSTSGRRRAAPVGGPMSGTTANLTFANPQPTHAGEYSVIVTNWTTRATSEVATVLVNVDTTGPTLVKAVAQATFPPYRIDAAFSDSSKQLQLATAINTNNYVITQVGTTNRLIVTNAAPFGGTNVQLRLSTPWVSGAQYVLTVNGIKDGKGNVIAPDSKVSVGRKHADLFNTDYPWKCWQGTFPFEGDIESYVGKRWITNYFVDPALPDLTIYGPGIFYFDYDPSADMCGGTRGTRIFHRRANDLFHDQVHRADRGSASHYRVAHHGGRWRGVLPEWQ